jgi:hypothetical protein
MSKVTFHVSTYHHPMWGGQKRYIRVFVYDTPEELRKAAGHGGGDFVGCFEPVPTREFYNITLNRWEQLEHPNWGGVMRLCRPHLHYAVLVHESAHAAAAIYRMDVKKQLNLGYGCHANEEMFSYLLGDIADGVIYNVLKIY